MRRLLLSFCFLLEFYNNVYAQDKIVIKEAYCIDETLTLSKDNKVDRILCSGGCDIRLYFVVNISGKNGIDNFLFDFNNGKEISFYAYLKGHKDTLVFKQCDLTTDSVSVSIPIYSVLPETSHPLGTKKRIKDLKKRHYLIFKNKLNKKFVLYILIDSSHYCLDFPDIDMPVYDEDKFRIKRGFCY